MQRSAFLEFRITDETNALEKAIPAMDRVLRQMGIRGEGAAAGKPSAVEQLLGGDTRKHERRGRHREEAGRSRQRGDDGHGRGGHRGAANAAAASWPD